MVQMAVVNFQMFGFSPLSKQIITGEIKIDRTINQQLRHVKKYQGPA